MPSLLTTLLRPFVPAGFAAPGTAGSGLPVPDGVVEVPCPESAQALVELNDGSLLTNCGHVSRDGGRTWPEQRDFGNASGNGILRLLSGKLALVSSAGYGGSEGARIWLSSDEGMTWILAGSIALPGGPVFELGDTMIQIRQGRFQGRLLYCWDYDVACHDHPGMEYNTAMARGRWNGQTYDVEGHAHIPEFFGSGFSWSDDEGRTWEYARSGNMPTILMGWFDFDGEPNGMCGVTPAGEASVAETADDTILYFGRSTVGRIVSSISCNGGRTWAALRPTELAASNSPPRLRRIPQTGDLLCMWNQVSGEEIRRGFRRSRLSAAISKNGGTTWESFRTIEVCEGLDVVPRVAPDPQVRMVRARQDLGDLPEGYGFYHYGNVCFAKDQVFVIYLRGGPQHGIAEQILQKQDMIMRIYPLEWFYRTD